MANRSRAIWERLQRSRSVALLDPGSPEECLRAFELLDPLGIVLEVALRSEHALPGVRGVVQAYPEALLLAGTVLTREQAEGALALGVAGVVSPDYVPSVVEACVDADVMCVPGGLSDCGKQLVQKAELYGCSLEELRRDRPWQWVYKLFPASANEVSLTRSVAAWQRVYPGIRFLYTGGVTLENVDRMARMDPEGIFCGSALTRHLDDPAHAREDAKRWLRGVTGEVVPQAAPGQVAPPENGEKKEVAGTPSPPSRRTVEVASAPERSGGVEGDRRGVVAFGEIMLRLSPPAGVRFRAAGTFEATHGGAEANVAAALAQWGIPSRFVTALPENDLGEGALEPIRALGVDTTAVLRREGRMGVYFLEQGASQRPPRVIYDRAGSAFAGLQPGEVDWEAALTGAAWLHCSGITPALSEGAEAVVWEGVRAARDRGLTVSFDLNYRAKLWARERAREVLTPLVGEVDVLVGNRDQLASFFPGPGEEAELPRGRTKPGWADGGTPMEDVEPGVENGNEALARHLVDHFGLRLVALTARGGASASRSTWQAFLHDGTSYLCSTRYTVDVVDGVGAGDAFTAGLIYGTITGRSRQEALELGAAAACLKMTMAGDILLATAEEVTALAQGRAAGGIQR